MIKIVGLWIMMGSAACAGLILEKPVTVKPEHATNALPAGADGFDTSKLTPDEKRDFVRYPHMMRFLKEFNDVTMVPTPAGNEHLIKVPMVFRPSQELWNAFFKNAIADKLTNLRALALVAREFKARGVTVYGPGRDFENAVHENHVDMGLSIPATNVGLGVWAPDPSIKDPEFVLHLAVVYTQRYIHQFPDEILPANLKMGYGDETDYVIDGKKYHGYLMTADLYYGPHGVGFKNVKGVGGQKRGVLGFFQKVLFFLPDAVHSMMIDDTKDELVTEALINTKVPNFETREVYRMSFKGATAKN